MTAKYESGIKVSIGKSQDVSLPPQVKHGRACCMHFDTDKAFLLPPSVPGVKNIVKFFNDHPGSTMLINGHTDLVGDAQYNLQLSNERAESVSAYLRQDVNGWTKWYDAAIQSKRWSYREDQHMLSTVEDASGVAYYAGPITGVNDAATQDAAGRFQTDNGLAADKQLGPDTRRVLVKKYMELEGTSIDPSTTIVLHGCGKHHPVDPNPSADEDNRRVEIFLFEGAVEPPPANPCPSPAGCTQYQEWVDAAGDEVDLCAEVPPPPPIVRICLIDCDQKPRGGVEYTLEVSGQTFTGTTGDDGMIVHEVPAGSTEGTLTYDDFAREVKIEPALAEPHAPDGARPRLRNLGFGLLESVGAALDEITRLAVMRFQQHHELEPTGELDTKTSDKLKERHGS